MPSVAIHNGHADRFTRKQCPCTVYLVYCTCDSTIVLATSIDEFETIEEGAVRKIQEMLDLGFEIEQESRCMTRRGVVHLALC